MLSKFITGFNFKVGTEPSNDEHTIVFDTEHRLIYVGDTVFCANNDDVEDAAISNLEKKMDEADMKIVGINEQIDDLNNTDVAHSAGINNNFIEIDRLKEEHNKLAAIIVGLTEKLDALNEQIEKVSNEVKLDESEKELSTKSLLLD